MTQSPTKSNNQRQQIPGLPDQPLTSEQHLDAIRCVQDRADQRVQLGTQLFKAAEAHTNHYKQLLGDIKTEQQSLRDQVDADVASSLMSYDKWIGDIDEGFGDAMSQLENKISRLQDDWQKTQARIESMMDRSKQMLNKSQSAIEQTEKTLDLQTQAVNEAANQTKKLAESVTISHEIEKENILEKIQPQAAATPPQEITPTETTPQEIQKAPTTDPKDNEDDCGQGVTDAKIIAETPTTTDDDDEPGQGVTDAKLTIPAPETPKIETPISQTTTNTPKAKKEQTEEPPTEIYTQLLDKLLNQYDKSAGD